jgi:hypothetical protein
VEVTSLIASQPIPADEAVASTFFAIQSETDGAAAFRRSMLSAPAQYFRANLAVPARPGKPAPCLPPPPTEKAYLPPADLKGYAVNCMTWPLQPDVRYEVYRSLDSTLLVQHKNEFLKGVQIAVAGLTVPGTITMTPSGAISEDRETKFLTGVFLTPSIIVSGADQFLNGRLEISSALRKNNYEVVVAKIVLPKTITGAAQVFKIQLTLRPVNVQFNIPPATATYKLTFLPDYKVVAKLESVLAALANHPALEKAYSLVSGVPVRTNSFNDMVAARGKNMFFYKIRAVSVSEVKSALSEASMPIYQMDTTPPDEIRELSAASIDNRGMLVWKRDASGDAKIYRLIRGVKPAAGGVVVTSEIELKEPALLPKPFFLINATTIQFNKPLVIPIPAALSRLTSTLPTPATNSFVNNSIRVKEILNQTTRLMVSSDKYAVNYTINLTEKKFVVSSVEFTQKRDAGIFFEVSVNSQLLASEADYLSYIDDGVDTGEIVAYALIPVKPAGPEPQVKITGLPSKLSAIEIRDYAKPAGIAATRQFIDITGAASTVFTIKSRCVIHITNSGKPAFIRITKQILPSDSNVYAEFINLSDKKRCKDWILISEPTASFMDDQLQLDNNVQYKIEFKSSEDIQTDPVIIH